jgi:cytosol aminopeptidase family protein
MTRARIAAGDLNGLDVLSVDAVALHLFQEKKQPRAVAGYVDWRMCGRLARLMLDDRFKGEIDETLLMPSKGRIGAERLFLVGLGDPGKGRFGIIDRVEQAGQMLLDAGARSVALGGPSFVLEAWLEKAKPDRFHEVVLLDADGALDGAEEALEASAKKAGFSWSKR